MGDIKKVSEAEGGAEGNWVGRMGRLGGGWWGYRMKQGEARVKGKG